MKIAGIITAKRTKVTKNGDIMAFIVIEDRYAEIEVIVFAKNYNKYSELIKEESAVIIGGNISAEKGEMPKILLSTCENLVSNSDLDSFKSSKTEQTLYIKVANLEDRRINNITRISALNRGGAKVVLYDESRKKYVAMKDVMIDPSEKVITKLMSLFGDKSVVLK